MSQAEHMIRTMRDGMRLVGAVAREHIKDNPEALKVFDKVEAYKDGDDAEALWAEVQRVSGKPTV